MKDLLDFVGTYSIADFIPMESAVYIRLFERANENLWPLPLFTVVLGIALTILVILQRDIKNIRWQWIACSALGAAWLSVGYQFHLRLLSELVWIGNFFGLLFFIQGSLLLLMFLFGKPTQSANIQTQRAFGAILMVCSVVVYPLIPWVTDRSWSSGEFLAIAPDPTCLMTLGYLLTTDSARWWVLIIPVFWCVISGAAAYAMGLSGGLFLLAAGVSVLLVIARRTSTA